MTVGSMIVKRDPPMTCSRCKHEIPKGATAWYTKGKRGYWCQACQDDWLEQNMGTASKTETTTTTTAAPENPARLSPNESDVAKGHRENMESARQTRDMIAALTVAVSSLQKELSVLVTVLREGQR